MTSSDGLASLFCLVLRCYSSAKFPGDAKKDFLILMEYSFLQKFSAGDLGFFTPIEHLRSYYGFFQKSQAKTLCLSTMHKMLTGATECYLKVYE